MPPWLAPWAPVYPAMALLFNGLALRAWARFARRGGVGWFLGGVAAMALAVDAGLVLAARLRELPSRELAWGVAAVVLAAMAYVASWVWRGLARA